MQRLRLSLWNNVFTYDMGVYASRIWHNMENFSTLLIGETGTEKSSAAALVGSKQAAPP
jgi:hypothetical protein